jgi:uncharacterized membrane protein YuzA (DUF378 family)
LRLLGRVILLPIAFVLAGLATLFVILTLGHERVIQGMAARQTDEATIDAAIDLMRFALSFASTQTLLPALLLVIAGEVARIRGVLYYVIGGGAALAIVPLLSRLSQPSGALDVSAAAFQVLAVGGFAGGFVYWLLAGRNA